MTGHPIPASLDALVAIAQQSVGDQIAVTDGPNLDTTLAATLSIGYSSDPTAFSIAASDAIAGSRATDIAYDIACEIQVSSGDYGPKVVRDKAFAVLNSLDVAVKADRRLGGAVTLARLTEVSYEPMLDDQQVAGLRFLIHCELIT